VPTTTAIPTTIAPSKPQNQPALPTGFTTMLTITASRTTSSQREINRMRRIRRWASTEAEMSLPA
jgi:hypothetical protein